MYGVNSPWTSVSYKVSTNGLKNVEKKGLSSPNQRPPKTLYLFFVPSKEKMEWRKSYNQKKDSLHIVYQWKIYISPYVLWAEINVLTKLCWDLHYTGNYFWLYLINGGSSFTSKNKGHTPNWEERKMATPSVLSFTENVVWFSQDATMGKLLAIKSTIVHIFNVVCCYFDTLESVFRPIYKVDI